MVCKLLIRFNLINFDISHTIVKFIHITRIANNSDMVALDSVFPLLFNCIKLV